MGCWLQMEENKLTNIWVQFMVTFNEGRAG